MGVYDSLKIYSAGFPSILYLMILRRGGVRSYRRSLFDTSTRFTGKSNSKIPNHWGFASVTDQNPVFCAEIAYKRILNSLSISIIMAILRILWLV